MLSYVTEDHHVIFIYLGCLFGSLIVGLIARKFYSYSGTLAVIGLIESIIAVVVLVLWAKHRLAGQSLKPLEPLALIWAVFFFAAIAVVNVATHARAGAWRTRMSVRPVKIVLIVVCVVGLAPFILLVLVVAGPALVLRGAAEKKHPERPPTPLDLSGAPEFVGGFVPPAPPPLESARPPEPAPPQESPPDDTKAIPSDRPRLEVIRFSVGDDTAESAGRRVRMRVLWLNETGVDIVLDDMRLRIYERRTAFAPLLTIGWGGPLLLTPQNTIVKNTDGRYFLPPGDGWEYDLVFDMNTNFDAARMIFGIIADYYSPIAAGGIDRAAVTSACLYMLRYGSFSDFGPRAYSPADICEGDTWLTVIDDGYVDKVRAQYAGRPEYLAFVEQLSTLLAKHRAFRPVPRS